MAASPIETVHAFLAAAAIKDYAAALRLIAPDCDYWNVPLSRVTGPEGVRAVLEPFFAPTLENDVIILRQAEAGKVVFTERLDRHRLADGWVELPVTGVFEVEGGRITLWRDYFHAPTILTKWPPA